MSCAEITPYEIVERSSVMTRTIIISQKQKFEVICQLMLDTAIWAIFSRVILISCYFNSTKSGWHYISIIVLFENPSAVVNGVSNNYKSVLMKYRKRIGDRDDPWGIPVLVGICFTLNNPRTIDFILSSINECANLPVQLGIPLFLRLWISLLWEMSSKAL